MEVQPGNYKVDSGDALIHCYWPICKWLTGTVVSVDKVAFADNLLYLTLYDDVTVIILCIL